MTFTYGNGVLVIEKVKLPGESRWAWQLFGLNDGPGAKPVASGTAHDQHAAMQYAQAEYRRHFFPKPLAGYDHKDSPDGSMVLSAAHNSEAM